MKGPYIELRPASNVWLEKIIWNLSDLYSKRYLAFKTVNLLFCNDLETPKLFLNYSTKDVTFFNFMLLLHYRVSHNARI